MALRRWCWCNVEFELLHVGNISLFYLALLNEPTKLISCVLNNYELSKILSVELTGVLCCALVSTWLCSSGHAY